MFGRKVTGGVCAAALAMFATAGIASAEDRQFGYALTITGSSDYLFRGISFTDNGPTANIYQEVSYGIAYAAAWTSNINNGAYGPWEQDIYVGLRPVTGPVSWDLQALYYTYGNRDGSSSDIDYFEFKIGATTTLREGLTVGANIFLTPDQGAAAAPNISYEGTVAYDLPKFAQFAPQFTALIGHTDAGDNAIYGGGAGNGYWNGVQSYTYWNAGVKVNVDKFFMDFRYSDTDIGSAGIDPGLSDARFVFSAGVNLLP
ncbi:TorF family putative porin [Hyphomicrobium sp. ghe19]|uniref:TorF family putative porin n=1 Tax=Hyphomicrobium sp. ghe19 TaxID=2682968 RepID=UPI00136784CD|nr:hypothetical protein HYPP_02895 [Hyphomicrobium sp. ghe19]